MLIRILSDFDFTGDLHRLVSSGGAGFHTIAQANHALLVNPDQATVGTVEIHDHNNYHSDQERHDRG